jgi:transposase
MATATTPETAKKILTQEEIFALAARAKEDGDALDELAAASALHAREARRAEFLEREVVRLEHRLELFLQKYFGRSSEKIDPAQLELFLKSEVAATAPEQVVDPSPASSKPRPAGHGRGTFPKHLKRERIALDPPVADRKCEVCRAELRRIREDITERGAYIPGHWLVNAYVRGVWACASGCSKPVMEPLPAALVEKSRFEPDVAVHTALAKYGDHLPLHRQTEIHARLGVDVPASTLGDAVQDLAALHAPTVEQMREEVVAEKVVHADDTPVVALIDRPEAAADQKKKERIETRVWVYRAAKAPKLCFDFTENRSREGPTKALRGFHGTLVADAAPSFNEVCRLTKSKRAGCYAHVRRKFNDARGTDPPRTARVLLELQRLFRLEAAAKMRQEKDPSFGPPALLALRRRRSRRVVDRFFALLERYRTEVLPKSPVGEAIAYALNQREALLVFLDDPEVPVDNNAAERALRCVATGRKNYLFFGSLKGGDAAATFYSLIGACRALELNPYAYLRETTETLLRKPDTPRSSLTPWAWAEARRALAMKPDAAPSAP